MPTKQTKARAIDQVKGSAIPGGELITSTAPAVGPAVPTMPGPTNLAVASNQLMFSAVTPMALIGLTWDAPPGIAVASYLIEAATNNTFTTGLVRRTAYSASASIELPTSTTYYFRVFGVTNFVRSGASNIVSVTTATDTTPSANPTSLAATFNAAGDLELSWVNPTSANFRDVEVSIYAEGTFTTLLYRAYTSLQRLVWTASQNRQAGGGTPDPAVFVRMASRSWAGVINGSPVTPGTQPVKSLPANVSGLTQSWSGDAGTAGADLVISWSAASGASFYRLSIDGVSRDVFGLRYVYALDQNTSEHSGTPDPVLSLSIVGVDGLDQVSASATTATATNAAPAAPSLATLIAAPGLIAVSVSAVEPPDFLTYRFRIIQTLPSAGDVTVDSQSKAFTYSLATAATYQVGVRVVDRFGQTSAETLTGTSVLDLTIATLRAEAVYSDSVGTAAATLKAALADDNRASGGISYGSSGSERWIRFSRALTERYRYATLAMANVSGSASWYIRTSNDDGATWSYYAGPVTGRVLTAVASQAAAQATRVAIGTLGSVAAGDRVEFPTTIEARYVEVYWLNSTGTTRVDEFYPRRLVEADDIRAQTLAAISADLGSITAGTITGATIQTATSGARVELTSANGLRSYDSSNVLQTQIRTSDGELYAGGGDVRLGSYGIRLDSPSAFTDTAALQFYDFATSTLIGDLQTRNIGGGFGSDLQMQIVNATEGARMLLIGHAEQAADVGSVGIYARSGTGTPVEASILTSAGSTSSITLSADETTVSETLTVSGGLNLGTATGAIAGGVRATVSDAGTTTRPSVLLLGHESSGTPAAGFGTEIQMNAESSTTAGREQVTISARWVNATDASRQASLTFLLWDTTFRVPLTLAANGSAPTIGFFGATPAARPTVTGSRGGNAALASLLTGLAGLGLITDSSTA